MIDTKEYITTRLATLRKSLMGLQNNANAHIGAIEELEKLLKEIGEDGIPAGAEAGLDSRNVSSNPT